MSYNGQQQNYYCDGYGYTYAIYPQYGYQPTPPTYEANNYYPENHYYNQQYTTTVPEYPHVPEGTSIPPPKISQNISFTPVNVDIANQVRAVCELCFSNNGLSKVSLVFYLENIIFTYSFRSHILYDNWVDLQKDIFQ